MTDEAVRQMLLHAARRKRVVDDHMFAPDPVRVPLGTFRLQVFTAPGARPVVVAVQSAKELPPLGLMSESAVSAVWQRYFPHDSVPPIWIERRQSQHELVEEYTRLVAFQGMTAPYLPADATWHRISDDDLAQLVGRSVDLSRGKGYRPPPPPEPEPELLYVPMSVARLPKPKPFRQPDCMPNPAAPGESTPRGSGPSGAGDGCCWYHGGDWHRVCAIAIELTEQARQDGVPGSDTADYVREQVESRGLSDWEKAALESLLHPNDGIAIDGDGWLNGQHRAQAMIDAGVTHTIVVERERPAQETGAPAPRRGLIGWLDRSAAGLFKAPPLPNPRRRR